MSEPCSIKNSVPLHPMPVTKLSLHREATKCGFESAQYGFKARQCGFKATKWGFKAAQWCGFKVELFGFVKPRSVA